VKDRKADAMIAGLWSYCTQIGGSAPRYDAKRRLVGAKEQKAKESSRNPRLAAKRRPLALSRFPDASWQGRQVRGTSRIRRVSLCARRHVQISTRRLAVSLGFEMNYLDLGLFPKRGTMKRRRVAVMYLWHTLYFKNEALLAHPASAG